MPAPINCLITYSNTLPYFQIFTVISQCQFVYHKIRLECAFTEGKRRTHNTLMRNASYESTLCILDALDKLYLTLIDHQQFIFLVFFHEPHYNRFCLAEHGIVTCSEKWKIFCDLLYNTSNSSYYTLGYPF